MILGRYEPLSNFRAKEKCIYFSKIKVDFRIVNCRFSLKAFIYIFIIPIFFNKF